MTDNLALDSTGLILSDEAFAVLQRQAGIRLAGKALKTAGGDRDAAKTLLRPALEAIGLLPYEPAAGKYHWGQAI